VVGVGCKKVVDKRLRWVSRCQGASCLQECGLREVGHSQLDRSTDRGHRQSLALHWTTVGVMQIMLQLLDYEPSKLCISSVSFNCETAHCPSPTSQ
jgi:hypothetical protein